jgi:aminoethylphosphonate catabolism LysR family transcriptional regulator
VSLVQFRAFHNVAAAGGFSRAAREMSVSQSTLSAQVRQLEARSSVALFERKPLGVTLTPEGCELFEVTKRLFEAEKEAEAMLGTRRHNGGHLRVAADGAFHPVPILRDLQRSRPNLTFNLSIGNSADVVEQLVSHRADVGITAFRPVHDDRLHIRPFLSMRIGIFIPLTHEWAERPSILASELNGRTIVMREKGSATRETFELTLADHGVQLGGVLEASSREAVRELVANGLGIGVVGEFEFGHDARLCFLSIADGTRVISEYAMCLQERYRIPIVRDFISSATACGQAAIGASVPDSSN